VLTLETRSTWIVSWRSRSGFIEQQIRKPVRDFAYCNGWYSDEIVEALVEHGFRSA